jgi:hypothetical protein
MALYDELYGLWYSEFFYCVFIVGSKLCLLCSWLSMTLRCSCTELYREKVCYCNQYLRPQKLDVLSDYYPRYSDMLIRSRKKTVCALHSCASTDVHFGVWRPILALRASDNPKWHRRKLWKPTTYSRKPVNRFPLNWECCVWAQFCNQSCNYFRVDLSKVLVFRGVENDPILYLRGPAQNTAQSFTACDSVNTSISA